jgi:hypothetical protein
VIYELYKEVSMKEVLDAFFSNTKEVVIVRTDNQVAVIYGHNKNTLKYYGLIDSIPLNKNFEDFSKYHLFPAAKSFCFHLHDKNRITEEIY